MPIITQRAGRAKPAKLPLSAADRDNLCESGLTDVTIRANGLTTENGSLVFPYHDLEGKPTGFARLRPHKPRKDRDGKAIKYESPKGSTSRAYFPAASRALLTDVDEPLYVTEGEKKALALSQLGVAAVGLGGIWCGCKPKTTDLLDDLAAMPLEGRTVYVVFDYDEQEKTRRQTAQAQCRLADAFRRAGVEQVYGVELPPGVNGKQGVDDFLVAQGEAEFRDLITQAVPVPSAEAPTLDRPSGRTDTANASRLATRFNESIRWVGPWDKWLIWDGRRWQIDQSLHIDAFAKQIGRGIWEEAKKFAGTEAMKSIAAFAVYCNGASGIRNMVALARSEPNIPVPQEHLDADPWLLNVENGTIDLRTGELREHRRADFITKLAPVAFDPAAACPVWEEFLETIFAGNRELIAYLRRLVGYCVSGVTEEHVLPFLYGTGANGKSTFCEVIQSLFGADYAMKAPPDLLMAKRGETHPTERADLFGKRFVACIETEDGRRLAESLVKELTGGDRVRARRMREDFWEFTPTHHVWLVGNHKPTVAGTDHGIWRRIKVIPFDVVIPDEQQDKKLTEKLRAELSGILNWAVAGCLEWQREGLREPETVRLATQGYSAEMDHIGLFIDEYCQIGPDYSEASANLFAAFQRTQTDSKVTQHAFGAALGRRGFTKARITKGVYAGKHGWKGLRLRKYELPGTITNKTGGA